MGAPSRASYAVSRSDLVVFMGLVLLNPQLAAHLGPWVVPVSFEKPAFRNPEVCNRPRLGQMSLGTVGRLLKVVFFSEVCRLHWSGPGLVVRRLWLWGLRNL